MRKLTESIDYPCINFRLELSNNSFIEDNALADTGADVHGLFIPKGYIDTSQLAENIHPDTIGFSGKETEIEVFIGQVEIAGKFFETTIAIYPGDEMIIGRGILDKVKSCFDGPKKRLTIYQ